MLVVGIGGGVAVACLQLAKLAGARVLVISSPDDRIARAFALGADAGINYRTEGVAKCVHALSSRSKVPPMAASTNFAKRSRCSPAAAKAR